MGLFEKLFKNSPRARIDSFFKTLSAYTPSFKTFNGSIYESELVRSSINAIATHASKLEVTVKGSAQPILQSRLRLAPNEFQTWGQFLSRLATILYVNNTAIIVPVYDQWGRVCGIFPVRPQSCELVSSNGEPWIRYTFRSGETAADKLANVGLMTRMQYDDDFFGSTNHALIPTMELISMQNQAINEGIKSAATYRFMAQLSNFSKPEDLAKERKRFSDSNLSAEAEGGGLLLFPNTYSNIQQISSKPFTVDDKQMELIKNNVFDYFGINEDVIQNKAIGDKWDAFYEGCIEPFAIQLSDVLTKMLFTKREQADGTFCMATTNRMQYMTNTDKLNVASQMADRGLMTRNEIRAIFNLPPLSDDIGNTLPARGEYYNVGEDKE